MSLILAGFIGITVTADGRDENVGLVALDGLVGETMLVLAVALIGLAATVALGKVAAPAFIGLGAVAALSVFISRASLSSDADTVAEFIGSQGNTDGLESALATSVNGTVTAVDVDPAVGLLAMAGAATLVAIGWTGFVLLQSRRDDPGSRDQQVQPAEPIEPAGPAGPAEPAEPA